MPEVYFEDIEVGVTVELGTYTVTADEIRSFAERWDPLGIHVDEAAAADSMHGGIIASGFHTLCIANKLVVEGFRAGTSGTAGLTIEELQWRAPVTAGDTLSVSLTIADKRASESRPEVGIVVQETEAANQDGETVLAYRDVGLYGRRSPA